MSAINVNSITGRTGTHGPVLTGVTTATNGLNVTGGNVGIGTDNPEKELEVSGSSSPTIRINNSDGSISADQTIGAIEFKANDASGDGAQVTGSIESIAQAAFTGQGSPSNLIFKTNGVSGADALTERLRINSNGDLGINTTGGTYTVQMHEPSAGSFTLQMTTGAVGGASTSGARITASASRKLYIENQENEDTLFYNNGGEKLVIKSGGNVNITNGDLVIGTSGHGIDFSVTGDGSGTATSELLDEYEEGTYIPVMVQGVTSPTYAIQAGRYTRIGNKVYVDFYIRFASGAANGSAIQIGGLPFNISNLSYGNVGAGILTRGGGGTSFQNLNSSDGNITFYGATPQNYFSSYIGGASWATVVADITNMYIIGTFNYNAD